jgi:hypothetical protein
MRIARTQTHMKLCVDDNCLCDFLCVYSRKKCSWRLGKTATQVSHMVVEMIIIHHIWQPFVGHLLCWHDCVSDRKTFRYTNINGNGLYSKWGKNVVLWRVFSNSVQTLLYCTKPELWRGLLAKFNVYSSPPVSTGNTFQDLPQLRETTDNTERYI